MVHDALEMMWCLAASYFSWLTPMTMVMSSSLAGAEMITFFAPAVMWPFGLVRLGEEAGGLDHDVDAERLPRQLGRASFARDT